MSIELEKYKGQSTRFSCPKCGRKHSFTRYIDKETNVYVNEKVGICNRKIKCGYHLSPKQFFENNPSYNQYPFSHINTNGLNKKEIIPIKQIDKEYLKQTLSKPSNFLSFLIDNFPFEKVEEVMVDYFVGGTKDKNVVFWQIDNQFRIRTGKIMQYDSQTCHRIKSEKPSVTWVHSELKKQEILPMGWQLTQCLFGLHLLIKYPKKPVMLVESEKTAIIMSIFQPSFNWLATGSVNNLSCQKIYSIRKCNIMAFPDLKCFELWKSKAEKISHEIGSKIEVSSFLEENSTPEQKEKGLDIADFYLSEKLKDKN